MAAPAKKTKKNSTKTYKSYKIEGDKLARTRKSCPKCGAGVFMAQHKDRVSCGKCHYTEFSGKKG